MLISRFDPQKPTGLYPEAMILKICKAHKIPHDRYGNLLFQTLEHAAHVYRLGSEGAAPKLAAQDVKKYMADICKALHTLQTKMDDMPEQVEDAYYGTISAIEENKFQEAGENEDLDSLAIDPEALQKSIDELQLIWETALNGLKPRKGGRPENLALFLWVRSVSKFWVETLKRPYKVDGYKGAVITDAGNFLSDCLSPLDASSIDLLYSQMRRYRAGLKREAA